MEPNRQPRPLINAVYKPTLEERLSVSKMDAITAVDHTAQTHPASAPSQPFLHKYRKKAVQILEMPFRYLIAVLRLGHIYKKARRADARAEALEKRVDHLEHMLGQVLTSRLDHHDQYFASVSDALDDHAASVTALKTHLNAKMVRIQADLAVTARHLADLTRANKALASDCADPAPAQAPSSQDLSVDPGLKVFQDAFYHHLENLYRGSRDEIASRLRIYLPDVKAAVLRTGEKPVMDLGCGRGEWLMLMAEMGLPAFGIDTNQRQIDEAQQEGLDARLGNALDALAEAPENSVSVISAHHLVEHLPFDKVAWIVREAMRVLAPGGVLLFETPNTRNILVGATTFYTDPTHIKPMPEQVLGPLFKTAGFHPIDIRHLNAHERLEEFLEMPDFNDELAFLMFGPQDLAVLGHKPLGE